MYYLFSLLLSRLNDFDAGPVSCKDTPFISAADFFVLDKLHNERVFAKHIAPIVDKSTLDFLNSTNDLLSKSIRSDIVAGSCAVLGRARDAADNLKQMSRSTRRIDTGFIQKLKKKLTAITLSSSLAKDPNRIPHKVVLYSS